MARFGSYDTTRTISRTGRIVLYEAHRVDDPDGRPLLVEVCESAVDVLGETASAREQEQFLQGAKQQQTLASGDAPHWAPVHEYGRADDVVYRVTDFYQLSAASLAGRVRLDAAGLYHVIDSVVRGLIELHQQQHRPFNGLRPEHILIEANKPLALADIRLNDLPPAPAKAGPEAQLADLRSVGELIHQLVVGELPEDTAGWGVPAGPRWQALGARGERWRQLCETLLSRDLTIDQMDLETFEARVDQLAVRPSASRRLTGITASGLVVVILAALGAYWLLKPPPLPQVYLVHDYVVLAKHWDLWVDDLVHRKADWPVSLMALRDWLDQHGEQLDPAAVSEDAYEYSARVGGIDDLQELEQADEPDAKAILREAMGGSQDSLDALETAVHRLGVAVKLERTVLARFEELRARLLTYADAAATRAKTYRSAGFTAEADWLEQHAATLTADIAHGSSSADGLLRLTNTLAMLQQQHVEAERLAERAADDPLLLHLVYLPVAALNPSGNQAQPADEQGLAYVEEVFNKLAPYLASDRWPDEVATGLFIREAPVHEADVSTLDPALYEQWLYEVKQFELKGPPPQVQAFDDRIQQSVAYLQTLDERAGVAGRIVQSFDAANATALLDQQRERFEQWSDELQQLREDHAAYRELPYTEYNHDAVQARKRELEQRAADMHTTLTAALATPESDNPIVPLASLEQAVQRDLDQLASADTQWGDQLALRIKQREALASDLWIAFLQKPVSSAAPVLRRQLDTLRIEITEARHTRIVEQLADVDLPDDVRRQVREKLTALRTHFEQVAEKPSEMSVAEWGEAATTFSDGVTELEHLVFDPRQQPRWQALAERISQHEQVLAWLTDRGAERDIDWPGELDVDLAEWEQALNRLDQQRRETDALEVNVSDNQQRVRADVHEVFTSFDDLQTDIAAAFAHLDPRPRLPEQASLDALRENMDSLPDEQRAAALASEHQALTAAIAEAHEVAWTYDSRTSLTRTVRELNEQFASLRERVAGGYDRYIERLLGRDQPEGITSTALVETWQRGRDTLVEQTRSARDLGALITGMNRLETSLQQLEGLFDPALPSTAEPASLHREVAQQRLRQQREIALRAVVASAGDTGESFSIDQATRAETLDQYRAYRANVSKLLTRARQAERRIDQLYAYNGSFVDAEAEAPASLEALWDSIDATVREDFRVALGPLPLRLDQLRTIASLDPQDATQREQLHALLTETLEASEVDSAVLYQVWHRLSAAEDADWPHTIEELRTARTTHRHIESALPSAPLSEQRRQRVAQDLRVLAQRNWQMAVRSMNDPAALVEAAQVAGSFNVELNLSAAPTALGSALDALSELDDDARWNLLIVALNGRRDQFESLETDESLKPLAQAFLAQLQAIAERSPSSRKQAVLAQFEEALSEQGAGPADEAFGPAAAGWQRLDEADDQDQMRFTSPDGLHTLTFVRVQPAVGQPAFVSVSEVSLGLFITLVGQRPTALTDYLPQDMVGMSGPSTWAWSGRGDTRRLDPRPNWLAFDSRWEQTGLLAAADQYGRPTDEHPVTRLSITAALHAAQRMNCRLPTMDEWHAADEVTPEDAYPVNRRDQTWGRFHNIVSSRRVTGDKPWPDGGIALPEGQSFPREQAASHDAADNDNVLWFAPTNPDASQFEHLRGNVAEFVLTDWQGAEDALATDAVAEVGALDNALKAAPERVQVTGGSALSPPALDPTTAFQPEAQSALWGNGFSDVGFRVAFTAPHVSLAARLQYALDGEVLAAP